MRHRTPADCAGAAEVPRWAGGVTVWRGWGGEAGQARWARQRRRLEPLTQRGSRSPQGARGREKAASASMSQESAMASLRGMVRGTPKGSCGSQSASPKGVCFAKPYVRLGAGAHLPGTPGQLDPSVVLLV